MIERYSLPGMAKVWAEENKLRKMVQVEVLVCEAWGKLGKIPKPALEKIKRNFLLDPKRIKEIEEKTQHDVVAFVEALSEKIGEEAKYLHYGMTSSDVIDTVFSLQLIEAADLLIKDLEELAKTLKSLAKKYKNTVMIGRTHGMHAEPITFGFKLATWYAETLRNLERMKRAREIVSYAKISGAVGTYAHLKPEVETYVCEKLGLKAEPISTQIVPRDRYAEYLTSLALVASSIEKFGLEIRHLQRSEVNEVEEYFGKGQRGSSAMPHKRNPILSERLCGLSRIIRANLFAGLENVPLWHERDISHSSVERVIFPDSTILLDYILQKFNSMMKNLSVYPEKMRKNLELTKGLIFSQKILLTLMDKGLTRSKAYELVQRNALRVNEKQSFQELVLKDKSLRRYLKEKEIAQCFKIENYLQNLSHIFKKLHI